MPPLAPTATLQPAARPPGKRPAGRELPSCRRAIAAARMPDEISHLDPNLDTFSGQSAASRPGAALLVREGARPEGSGDQLRLRLRLHLGGVATARRWVVLPLGADDDLGRPGRDTGSRGQC